MDPELGIQIAFPAMDNDTLSTLSCEDALTLEWEDTDDEFAGSMDFSEPDTEAELDQEDETDDFWPTSDQVDLDWTVPDQSEGI